jgi:2-dehydro-3-deoxygalactonokinase
MTPFCAAVDWGTSSFRLWVLDQGGGVLAERRSGEGMTEAGQRGFAAVLEDHLSAIGVAGDLPAIICGMAGARQGWMEAGYVDTPANLEALASAASRPDSRRDVRVLPGVAQRDPARPDVMRGEETQIVGLIEEGLTSGIVCLPGTHSKWVEVRDRVITGFSTFMTGETFALFREHSILRHDASGAADADDPAFAAAVRDALASPERFLHLAFSVRPASLMGLSSGAGGASRLSGLLIGLEIAGARSAMTVGRKLTLSSSGALMGLYRRAFEIAAFEVRCVEAESVTRQGLLKSARTIWAGEATP